MTSRKVPVEIALLAVKTRPTVSVYEAAALLGVGQAMVRRAIDRDEIDAIRVGERNIRVKSAPLREKLGL